MFIKKKSNNRGFTLAELLIVIAIIAVLIAIAVPVFSSSMKRANMAVDDANFREAKSMAVNAILTGFLDCYVGGSVVEKDLSEIVSAAAGGSAGFFYTTDGYFVLGTEIDSLPSGVELVTAKYTADASDEGTKYSDYASRFHVRGSKIYLTITSYSGTDMSIASDDEYILQENGMYGIVMGFTP